MPHDEFIDYYELMQISPNAETPTIRRVYRLLAARFHPDNPETGDMDMFMRLNSAYRTLISPELRAGYDADWAHHHEMPIGVFGLREFASGIDSEGNRRMGVLCLLMNRRRTNPDSAGWSVLELERAMALPREHLLYTLWYLKEKSLIRQNENSDLVITSDGVDFVEQRLPEHKTLYRLLKAAEGGGSRTTADPPWPEDSLANGDDNS